MKSIKLFWFSKYHLQGIQTSNFGDDINPFLIEKITGKKIVWKNPDNQNWYEKNFTKINFAIGSILHFATNNSNIWGSGLIDSKSKFSKKAEYFAVRGPETYKILKNAGCKVNNVFGDPALLLPKYFPIEAKKKYQLGIIPHYAEVDDFKTKYENSLSDEIKIIDLKGDVMQVLQDIVSCDKIISSSLHGIIVAMAYQIPSLRMNISDKIYGDGIKYQDFYESVGIKNHPLINIRTEDFNWSEIISLFKTNEQKTLINNDISLLQEQLIKNIPF